MVLQIVLFFFSPLILFFEKDKAGYSEPMVFVRKSVSSTAKAYTSGGRPLQREILGSYPSKRLLAAAATRARQRRRQIFHGFTHTRSVNFWAYGSFLHCLQWSRKEKPSRSLTECLLLPNSPFLYKY